MWSVASVNTQILVKVLYGCLRMRHVCGHFPPTYVALYISSERRVTRQFQRFPPNFSKRTVIMHFFPGLSVTSRAKRNNNKKIQNKKGY